MIVFDLACPAGHVFEAWFGSQTDYEEQRERALLSCPVCGAPDIVKAPMAPRISTGHDPAGRTVPAVRNGSSAPDPKALLGALMAAQARMLAGSEDVGSRFAEEARAIHEGDADQRPIHGQATPDEARALAADGLPVMPLLLPVRDRSRDH